MLSFDNNTAKTPLGLDSIVRLQKNYEYNDSVVVG
jgi:hypothetical protein